MDQTLNGKVAAITGAASGIGLACTRRLLAAGATVALVDRARGRLDELCAELGPKAFAVEVDLLDPKSVDRMMPAILDHAGQLDIFHANAGSYIGGDLLETTADQWDTMLALNVNAVFRTAGAAMPHMIERGTGDIVVTSSVAGHTAVPWEPIYTASKHAVQAFVHAMRRQLNKKGIRVMEVAPGPVVTPLVDDAVSAAERGRADTGPALPGSEAALILQRRQRHGAVRVRVAVGEHDLVTHRGLRCRSCSAG